MDFVQHDKTPEMIKWYTITDMAESLRQGMGIQWDSRNVQDGVHFFQGTWEKGNRVIRVYIKEETQRYSVSIAFIRTGYYPLIEKEIALVQKAMVLPSGSEKSAALEKFLDFVRPGRTTSAFADVFADIATAITNLSNQSQGWQNQSDAWRTDAKTQSDAWRTTFSDQSDQWRTSVEKITDPKNLAKISFGITFGAVLGASIANMIASGVSYLAQSVASGIHELVTQEKYKARVHETIVRFIKMREEYEKLMANAVAIEKVLESLAGFAGDSTAEAKFQEDWISYINRLASARDGFQTNLDIATSDKERLLRERRRGFESGVCTANQRIQSSTEGLANIEALTKVLKEGRNYSNSACAAVVKYFDTLAMLESKLELMRAELLNVDTIHEFLDGRRLDREKVEEMIEDLPDALRSIRKREINELMDNEEKRLDLYLGEKKKEIEACEERYNSNQRMGDVVSLKAELRRLRQLKEQQRKPEERDPSRVHSELFQRNWGFTDAVTSPLKFTSQSLEEYSAVSWMSRMNYRTEICRLVFDTTIPDRTPPEPNFQQEERTQKGFRDKIMELATEFNRSASSLEGGTRMYRDAEREPQTQISVLRHYVTQLVSDQSCYMRDDAEQLDPNNRSRLNPDRACDDVTNPRVTRINSNPKVKAAYDRCIASRMIGHSARPAQ